MICGEFERLDARTFAAVSEAVRGAETTPSGLNLHEAAFRDARDEPTERSVFEHSPAVGLAPIDVKWDDVGAWASVYDVNTKSDDGSVLNGDVMALDTTNSLVRSSGRLVVVIGMNDLIVVDTKDALLVTDRKHAQQVKLVVEKLKSGGRAEVVTHPFRKHVWGGIEEIETRPGYRLEILTVLPGSTMQINGSGTGTSFLSVVAGHGTYLENDVRSNTQLEIGSMLPIERQTRVSLTNHAGSDLRAFLLSMTPVARDPVRESGRTAADARGGLCVESARRFCSWRAAPSRQRLPRPT